MILAQAVVEPRVGGSSILVEFIIAVTPLVLGILTVLVKQFAATKALKKSEERTKLAFAVVDEKLVGIGDKVKDLETSIQSIPVSAISAEDMSRTVSEFCDKKMSAVNMFINELGQQVNAIAEKLNVVSLSGGEVDRETVLFRKSYFLKASRVPDMFPTNKKMVTALNQFFVVYLNLVEDVIFDLHNWATPALLKSKFDSAYAESKTALASEFGEEFAGLVKRELGMPYKKSVCDIVGIVFDIANSKKSRIYSVALAFAELSMTLWLKAYQEYLMKYSEEPGGLNVDDRGN